MFAVNVQYVSLIVVTSNLPHTLHTFQSLSTKRKSGKHVLRYFQAFSDTSP
jgi:hypothetical protein